MACMAAMATFGSVESNPHMVEQTQAKKNPNIAPAKTSDRMASGFIQRGGRLPRALSPLGAARQYIGLSSSAPCPAKGISMLRSKVMNTVPSAFMPVVLTVTMPWLGRERDSRLASTSLSA